MPDADSKICVYNDTHFEITYSNYQESYLDSSKTYIYHPKFLMKYYQFDSKLIITYPSHSTIKKRKHADSLINS